MLRGHKGSFNGNYNRRDAEADTAFTDKELRRQKRKKWILYIIAFVIFQTAVIALFSMTPTVMKFRTPKSRIRSAMKFRTPKFRIRSATFPTFDFQTSNPSFNLKMDARLGVKNTNFGPYKFDNTAIFFYYQDTQVGSATVRNSKANFRSTKKLDVAVDLAVPANGDLSSGILTLTGKAEMRGEVTIMFMFKKKKSTKLDCSIEVNTQTKALQNVKCK